MFPGYPRPSATSSEPSSGGVCSDCGVTSTPTVPETFVSPSLETSSTGTSRRPPVSAFSLPFTVTFPVSGSMVRSTSSDSSSGVPPSNLTRVSSSLTRAKPSDNSFGKRNLSPSSFTMDPGKVGSPDFLVRSSPESSGPIETPPPGYPRSCAGEPPSSGESTRGFTSTKTESLPLTVSFSPTYSTGISCGPLVLPLSPATTVTSPVFGSIVTTTSSDSSSGVVSPPVPSLMMRFGFSAS